MDKKLWNKIFRQNSLVNEANKSLPLDTLKNIIKNNQYDYIYLNKGGKVRMDLMTASMLMKVYNTLKTSSAKEKFERMLGTNQNTLKQLVSFGWSMMK